MVVTPEQKQRMREALTTVQGGAVSIAHNSAPVRLDCIHRGDLNGYGKCGSCNGNVQLKTFQCKIHAEGCTVSKPVPGKICCASCSQREPPKSFVIQRSYEEVTTRHLLYHCYPRAGSRWRERVLRLREHDGLFNGCKVMAVVTDGTCDPFDHVTRELDGLAGWEFLHLPNNATLREVTTFLPLFQKVAGHTGAGDVTLYAHAKGATRGAHKTAHRWVEILESIMLGDWSSVESVLRSHPVGGCFKKIGRGWAAHESLSDWHYSGSWFWFRNRELFSKPDWERIDQFWSGIEPYPSLHFSKEEAGSLFHEDFVQNMNLYDQNYWGAVIEPKFVTRRSRGVMARPLVQVELGGGETPRGHGYINVDRNTAADVMCDFETDPLPFEDASVDAVYSSHCLEHVLNLQRLLQEIARICRVGAIVEIRVPHWGSEMANCHDHKQTIGEQQAEHWCVSAIRYWFGDCPRRFRLQSTEKIPSSRHQEARKLFPHLTDDQLFEFVPNTCHEFRFKFEVVTNEFRR